VGNLLGSNLFNSLAVGGAIALIGPGPLVDTRLEGFGNLAMVGIAVVALIMLITGGRVTKGEGVLLFVLYLVSLAVLSGGDSDEEASWTPAHHQPAPCESPGHPVSQFGVSVLDGCLIALES
jgi:hypothetical protein